MDVRKKLVELLAPKLINFGKAEYLADYLVKNGVTCMSSCHKARSTISKTGFMCTTCYSDIERDAEFCKYCGAKVLP